MRHLYESSASTAAPMPVSAPGLGLLPPRIGTALSTSMAEIKKKYDDASTRDRPRLLRMLYGRVLCIPGPRPRAA